MNTTNLQFISNQEKTDIITIVFNCFNIELDRHMLTSSQEKISILTWVLEEYQSRKWSTVHTNQVIQRDMNFILGNALYRDFILGLTQRVLSEWMTYPDDIFGRILKWRLESALIYTLGEERYSLLNPEVFETLQVDKETYSKILGDNPWLLVYQLLLEYIPQWSEYRSYMKIVIESRKQESE